MKLDNNITYKTFGVKAILIEWEPIINEEILTDILKFKSKIENNSKVDFDDFVIGYNSLTLKYKKMRQLEAYAEEYQERIAIKIENGINENIAIPMARREVLTYAEKDGADIEKLMDMLNNYKKVNFFI